METLQLPGFDTLSVQLAQELYDPGNRLLSDDLAGSHGDFAAFVLDLYGVQPEDPEASDMLLSALVCDATESGLDTENVLISRAQRIVDVKKLVVPSVHSLVRRSQEQARDTLKQIDARHVPRRKRTLYASARIAQAAYDGTFRESGEQYYEHPKRAAAMALYLFNQLEAEGYRFDAKFKDAVICCTLLHDATEETTRSREYHNQNRPRGFSPLLVREIFRRTNNPYGQMVANSLRLMTRYSDQPWAPDYRSYVHRGSADFIFSLVKPLDMRDNLLHPRPVTDDMGEAAIEKIYGKRALYAELIGSVAINAGQHARESRNRLWAPRYFELLRGIELEDMPSMVQDLNAYIYGSPVEPTYNNRGKSGSGDSDAELLFSVAA